jgi:hypothetical protein
MEDEVDKHLGVTIARRFIQPLIMTFFFIGFGFLWHDFYVHASANSASFFYGFISSNNPWVTGIIGSFILMFILIGLLTVLEFVAENNIVATIVALLLGIAVLLSILVVSIYGFSAASSAFFSSYGDVLSSFISKHNLFLFTTGFVSAAAASFAYGAYRLRCVRRTLYGTIEVLFGMLTILYSTYFAVTSFVDPQPSQTSAVDLTQVSIQFWAGIYIMVRGLANIEDGEGLGHLTARKLVSLILRYLSLRSAEPTGALKLDIDTSSSSGHSSKSRPAKS